MQLVQHSSVFAKLYRRRQRLNVVSMNELVDFVAIAKRDPGLASIVVISLLFVAEHVGHFTL